MGLIKIYEKGNPDNYITLEALKNPAKNTVKSIKVYDSATKEVKYGSKKENKLKASELYTYEVKEFEVKNKVTLDRNKNNLKWCFWLDKTQGELSKEYFEIKETNAKEESEEDFLSKTIKKDTQAIEQKSILYAKKITEEKDGVKTVKLEVKFSKWLDGEFVRVEAYVDTPTLDSGKDAVASRTVLAKPEIAEIYWTTKDGERIEKTGHNEVVYMNVNWLGLQNQTIEAEVYDKDIIQNEDGSTSDDFDKIAWKNNQFKIDESQRPFKRQFKVGSKEQYKEARDNENEYCYMLLEDELQPENLELYVTIANAKKLKLADTTKEYGQLSLTLENTIVDAYFATITEEKVALDAPMQDIISKKSKKKIGEKNQKDNDTQHEKLTEGVIGQKIKLVAETDNLDNDIEIVFQLFEKEALLAKKDEVLKVVQNDKEVTEVTAKVKDGYAVAEVLLRPKADTDFKTWLSTLKIDGKPSDRKKSHFYIKVNEKDSPALKEFCKEDGFEVISTNWHEPVDDPQIAKWNSSGNVKPQSNTFGMARISSKTGMTRLHTGLDIFVLEGSSVYACLDAEVIESTKYNGYGHTITLKVNNAQEIRNRKRDYTLAYDTDLKSKSLFDENSNDIFLFYAHLEDILVKKGAKVKAGDKIGKSGISGVTAGTYDPHLHFNMYSNVKKVLQAKNYLVNPAYYVYWKEIEDLTDEDIKRQDDRKKKGKLKNPNPKLSEL